MKNIVAGSVLIALLLAGWAAFKALKIAYTAVSMFCGAVLIFFIVSSVLSLLE